MAAKYGDNMKDGSIRETFFNDRSKCKILAILYPVFTIESIALKIIAFLNNRLLLKFPVHFQKRCFLSLPFFITFVSNSHKNQLEMKSLHAGKHTMSNAG